MDLQDTFVANGSTAVPPLSQLSFNHVGHFESLSQEELRRLEDTYDVYKIGREQFSSWYDDPDERSWRADTTREEIESATDEDKLRNRIRNLVRYQPNAKRALALYEYYVFGSDCHVTLTPHEDETADLVEDLQFMEPESDEYKKAKKKIVLKQRKQRKVRQGAARAVRDFLQANSKCWSLAEFGRRVWRDGEQFTRKFSDRTWPPQVRFIDPELIGDPVGAEEKNKGIKTDPKDICTPILYTELARGTNEELTTHRADRVWHTKIDVDSTEKRGLSRFNSAVISTENLVKTIQNEFKHRNAQTAIVLIRKVQSGRALTNMFSHSQNNQPGTFQQSSGAFGAVDMENYPSGSIITTGGNVDYEFRTPQSNAGDGSIIVKLLVLQLAACTGFTYTMLTGDSSNNSTANAGVEETPVMQMILAERQFFKNHLTDLFKWVIERAVSNGRISGVSRAARIWERYDLEFKWGRLVSRDPLRDVQAATNAVMARVWSPQEARRHLNTDSDRMEIELRLADMSGLYPNTSPMNSMEDLAESSERNALNDSGNNQNTQGGETPQDQGRKEQ